MKNKAHIDNLKIYLTNLNMEQLSNIQSELLLNLYRNKSKSININDWSKKLSNQEVLYPMINELSNNGYLESNSISITLTDKGERFVEKYFDILDESETGVLLSLYIKENKDQIIKRQQKYGMNQTSDAFTSLKEKGIIRINQNDPTEFILTEKGEDKVKEVLQMVKDIKDERWLSVKSIILFLFVLGWTSTLFSLCFMPSVLVNYNKYFQIYVAIIGIAPIFFTFQRLNKGYTPPRLYYFICITNLALLLFLQFTYGTK